MSMNEKDLSKVETHFAFGKNWAEYALKVGGPKLSKRNTA